MRSSETSVELAFCQRICLDSFVHLHLLHAYLHFSASINLPGVSRQRRISTACWRTTASASSSSRAWSSTGGGDVESSRLAVSVRDGGGPSRLQYYRAMRVSSSHSGVAELGDVGPDARSRTS